MKRKASATWNGPGLTGKGILDAPSGFFNQTPYSTKSRFENEDGKLGTSPEELIAAALSGCFCMALSFGIVNAGFVADELKAEATVTMDTSGANFAITEIHLQLLGKVAGMEESQFLSLAQVAKENCPVSKVLSAVPIHLDATFHSA